MKLITRTLCAIFAATAVGQGALAQDSLLDAALRPMTRTDVLEGGRAIAEALKKSVEADKSLTATEQRERARQASALANELVRAFDEADRVTQTRAGNVFVFAAVVTYRGE